jgi:CHAT domain-containing protein
VIRMSAVAAAALLAVQGCGRTPPARWAGANIDAYQDARAQVGSGRFAPAAQAYARVRDSFAAAGDSINQWYGQVWWSETMIRAGRLDSAAAGLELAWRLAGSDPTRIAWTNVTQSKWYERRGQLDSAIAVASRAAETYRAMGDPELGVYAHDVLGTPLSRRGRYREALAADSTSLALRQAIPLPPRVIAGGYNEVAIGYRHLGRYDEAEAALIRAYELARGQHDTLAMALALSNRASIKDDTGDRDGAIAALSEAMIYVEAVQHQRFITEANADLAALYLAGGNSEVASGYGARALVMARETGNRAVEISALEHLGRIRLAQAAPREALDSLGKARTLADSLGFGPERVSARVASVAAAVALGDAASALRLADQALAIADSVGDPAIRFSALEARAMALEAARNPGAAAAFGTSLDFLESLRGRLALGDLRMGIAAPRLSAYEGAIRTHLAAGRGDEAFRAAERARARLLLDVMVERGGTPASAAGTLRQRLWETHEARGAATDSASRSRLDAAIAALADSLSAVEGAEPLGRPRPVGVEELRRGLLEPGRALLAFFWGEKQVIAWWITRDSLRVNVLGSTEALSRTVDFLLGALQRPASDTLWRSAARRAYRELVAPLRPDASTEVLVVPDGPLHRIPLETLLADREPWGANRVIRYGPSASVLLALARPRPAAWTRTLLAVGNPTLTRAAETPGSARDPGLGPLPYAEREALAIQEIFKRDGADVLLGDRATVIRWLDREPGRYRYLHFALHAVASDRLIEGGALLFSGQPLSLADVRGLQLNAELVTLSACETAVGRWVRGEGVVGMQYAFLSAGARGALVTLWRVPDEAAADFAEAFYAEVKAGTPHAEALRRIRVRWMTAGDDRSHPSRWAGFVLVGGGSG